MRVRFPSPALLKAQVNALLVDLASCMSDSIARPSRGTAMDEGGGFRTAANTSSRRAAISRSRLSAASPAPTDYFPDSYSSSNVRARAQRESSSTRSTDLPVALAPPADVNKHGSS